MTSEPNIYLASILFGALLGMMAYRVVRIVRGR